MSFSEVGLNSWTYLLSTLFLFISVFLVCLREFEKVMSEPHTQLLLANDRHDGESGSDAFHARTVPRTNCRFLSVPKFFPVGKMTDVDSGTDCDAEGPKGNPPCENAHTGHSSLNLKNISYAIMFLASLVIVTFGPGNASTRWVYLKKSRFFPKSAENGFEFVRNDSSSRSIPLISPLSQQQLSEIFKFSTQSALNFLHLHKTGGQTLKTALGNYYVGRQKQSGEKVVVHNLCYASMVRQKDGSTQSAGWRCDLANLEQLSESARNKIDVVFGHQFAENGVSSLLASRNVNTFAILRHPFDRKVSFFYHFFVRAHKRNETEVSFYEVRDFLLHNRVHLDAPLGRDAGPNYFAGRLLSDGNKGFVGDFSNGYYEVASIEEDDVIRRAKDVLRSFVFVGIQSEPDATMCVIRTVVRAFDIALNLQDDKDASKFGTRVGMMNKGSYSMSAEQIWDTLSEEERQEFERKEHVDLEIYREAERLFRNQLTVLRCNSDQKR